MIESIMYFGIGFLFAALSVLIVVPLVHGRAVRLTTRRLEGAIPSSMTEIRAHKDLLRAEFAMTTRDLEAKIEQLKTEKANQLTELGKKGDAINRLKIDLGVLRDQLRAAEEKFEAKATALDDAEHALSDRESKLTTVLGELDERSALADVRKIEIIALKTQIEAKATTLDNAEHALSDRESKLTTVLGELDERSALADAQKIEIIALKTQVEALKERLDLASNELQAVEDRRDADRIELKAATQKLMEERGKFENFHHRVAELVKQVVTQTTEDKILARRAQDDLENRLVEQSRLLNEREFELKHLREEIEIARKAESDLRVAIIEIDGRDKTATQNLEAEKAKLQAALDRANGERMRLAHELASLKRQGKEARAA
jgi:chromosome segregation ATPase